MTGHAFDAGILREYDIRGVVGETLGPADAAALGRAFGSMVVRAGGRTAALGHDGRLSSPTLAAALADGLVSTGLEVFRVGLGPTPMLYFADRRLECGGAVMVTGSHNPRDHNGFKMALQGRAVYGADIREIGKLAAAGDYVKGAGRIRERPVLEEYLARLLFYAYLSSQHNLEFDAGK
jgi:phosphomannomutase